MHAHTYIALTTILILLGLYVFLRTPKSRSEPGVLLRFFGGLLILIIGVILQSIAVHETTQYAFWQPLLFWVAVVILRTLLLRAHLKNDDLHF